MSDHIHQDHRLRELRAGTGGGGWLWVGVAGVAVALLLGLLAYGGGTPGALDDGAGSAPIDKPVPGFAGSAAVPGADLPGAAGPRNAPDSR